MNRVFVHGVGVVSPAGWGLAPFRKAVNGMEPVAESTARRPDGGALPFRRVPPPDARPAWMAHPRLRRSSPVSHFTVAAALEALGTPSAVVERPGLAVVACVLGGSVQYSRRFFGEVLADPSTASPLLFPETVFNAPASHLSAVLGSSARNHTLVADQTGFLAGLAMAADWIARGEVPGCVVVAAEEADWTTAEASRLFSRRIRIAEGAAAMVLQPEPSPVELTRIPDPRPHVGGRRAVRDAGALIREVGGTEAMWFHGLPRNPLSLEHRLGDGLGAAGGWAAVAAVDSILAGAARSAAAIVAGANLQSMAVRFDRGG